MSEFQVLLGNLFNYRGNDEVVAVPEGVTSIAPRAFANCAMLKKVILPDGVKDIGQDAFYACKNLAAISLPMGLTEIGKWAFRECTALKEIDIPESVTSIGEDAFACCTGLKQITIPGNVMELGEGLFYGCSNLTTVLCGDDNRVYHAENNCILKGTTVVAGCVGSQIPDGVTEIGGRAFAGRENLKEIVFPSSLISIGKDAFAGCSSLKEIIIPENVESIEQGAFFECGITSLKVTEENTIFRSEGNCILKGNTLYLGCESSRIPDGITRIGEEAFRGCQNLKAIEIPDSVRELSEGAFSRTGLTNVILPDGLQFIGDTAFFSCTELENVSIPDSVESIGNAAFRFCEKLKEIRLGDNLKKLGEGAFARSGLEHISIPGGIDEIAKQTFHRCDKLTDVQIGNGITHIQEDAFSLCTNLQRIALPESVVEIHKRAFAKCTELVPFEWPQKLKCIGDNAFELCKKMRKIVLPESMESIGECAFAGILLEDIVLPMSITAVDHQAFSSYDTVCAPGASISGVDSKMKVVLLRGFVAHTDLFGDDKKNEYIKYMIGQRKKLLSEAVKDGKIEWLVAYERLGVALPDALCDELLEVASKQKKTDIAAWLLDYKNRRSDPKKAAKSLQIKESRELSNPYMVKLMKDTWKWDKQEDGTLKLTKYTGSDPDIVIPPVIGRDPVTCIDFSVFYDCKRIESISIPSGITQIRDLSSQSDKAPVITVSEENACYRVIDGCLLDKNILVMAYPGREIPACVTEIGWRAFMYCQEQERVDIPDSVKKIGDAAFMMCRKLKEVRLPGKLTKLGRNMFSGCASLEEIIIPETVKSIDEGAFGYCVQLNTIVLANNVTKIGKQAFYHCSGLNNVTISQSVTAIGAEAFYCCIGLEDVLIPESVQKIGKKAFAGCLKLRIHGKEGSAAQQYAQSEGIRFVAE